MTNELKLVQHLRTSKHKPIFAGERPHRMAGVQALFRFANGYGASLVYGFGTYDWELAAIRYFDDGPWDFEVDNNNPVTEAYGGILPYIGPVELEQALDTIKALPSPWEAVTDASDE